MGGAKAPPISRVVPSYSCSVVPTFRRAEVPMRRNPDAQAQAS